MNIETQFEFTADELAAYLAEADILRRIAAANGNTLLMPQAG